MIWLQHLHTPAPIGVRALGRGCAGRGVGALCYFGGHVLELHAGDSVLHAGTPSPLHLSCEHTRSSGIPHTFKHSPKHACAHPTLRKSHIIPPLAWPGQPSTNTPAGNHVRWMDMGNRPRRSDGQRVAMHVCAHACHQGPDWSLRIHKLRRASCSHVATPRNVHAQHAH